jgi:hypothetical protein
MSACELGWDENVHPVTTGNGVGEQARMKEETTYHDFLFLMVLPHKIIYTLYLGGCDIVTILAK